MPLLQPQVPFERYHIAGVAWQDKSLPGKAHADVDAKAGKMTLCHDK